ncbi:hypothetical protein ACTXG7_15285 [Mycolicibacterium sp. Dal123E01]|uniref:hypothetical protein n=1 Tax=Mycolicibacterium sp. Dal123E01 TaxID=3457578 RepID=UPI00403E64E4
MRGLAVWGTCGVAAAAALGLAIGGHDAVSWSSGIALAVALLAARSMLGRTPRLEQIPASGDADSSLSRWVERTESQIAWADSTRADWDRRLRPTLAWQFERVARQPRSRDPVAFDRTGRVLFGDDLWVWVDPENVARAGGRAPGPGRAVFTAIIERLERL